MAAGKKALHFQPYLFVRFRGWGDPYIQHEVPIVFSETIQLAGVLVDDVRALTVEDNTVAGLAYVLY